MNSVVIADDSAVVRKGLLTMIPWQELGVDFVDAVQNGREVIDILKIKKIDILISDIKMPEVDGIDLLKYIHENALHTSIIFLSAYQNFDYMQDALKYGASAYILKPINSKKINEIIEIVKKTLNLKQLSQLLYDEEKKQQFENEIFHMLEKRETDGVFNLINIDIQESRFAYEYYELLLRILIKFARKNMDESAFESNIFSEYALCRSSEHCRDFTAEKYVRFLETMGQTHRSTPKDIVQKVKKYIDNNFFDQELSAQKVSETFGYTNTYIGSIFKKEERMTITEYIFVKRMKEAQRLLEKTQHKIAHISNQCGYRDTRYFNKLFKRYTGFTPSEYRERG